MMQPEGVVRYVVAPIDPLSAHLPSRYAVFMFTKANPPSEQWHVTVVSKTSTFPGVSAEECVPVLGDNCFATMAEACHMLASQYKWPLPNNGWQTDIPLACRYCGAKPYDPDANLGCPKHPRGYQMPHSMVPSAPRAIKSGVKVQ